MPDLSAQPSHVPTTGSARIVRASDADRHATVLTLQDAVARGLLRPEEGSERMAAAYAATFLPDLDPLTADLPPAPSVREHRDWRKTATQAALRYWLVLAGGLKRLPAPVRVASVLLFAVLIITVAGFGLHDAFGGGGDGARGLGHPRRLRE